MTSTPLIPVIIPAYKPDESLIELLQSFSKTDVCPVIIVDDGSGASYRPVFAKAEDLLGENLILLSHPVNKGKGAALKTAFRYVTEHMKDAIGVVTADADGQHDAQSVSRVMQALLDNRATLILGVREFDVKDIPWKSRFGNTLTQFIVRHLFGLDLPDTQTGLRGIPFEMLDELTQIKYDRYEFEMVMLLQAAGEGGSEIKEIPIPTIYGSRDHHATHFHPVLDSIRIYRVLGAQLGLLLLRRR